MVLQWIVDIFNVIVEVWFGYWLFDVPSNRRFKQKWVRGLEYVVFIGVLGGNILLNRVLGIRFSNIQIITITIFYTLGALFFTKYPFVYSLALAGVYYGTVSLLEQPGIVLSGWITGQPYTVCIKQPIIYDYIYLLVLSLGILAFYRKWGVQLRGCIRNVIAVQNAPLWVGIAVAQWWVITYFLIIGHKESGRDVFMYNIVSIMFILLLLIAFSAFIVYRRTEALRQQKKTEEERVEAEYHKIRKEYERKSRELHDMRHRLQPLETYLTQRQGDKALSYMRELLGEVSDLQKGIHGWTGNLLVDSLLDGKQAQAQKAGIDFQVNVSVINTFLDDKDISVLLGNLLDNAVEAAECASEKYVSVEIFPKGTMLLIRLKNSFGRPPVEKAGKFISTKQDKRSHGWGLESVRAIVAKYKGELIIDYNDSYFEVTVIFLDVVRENNGKRNKNA